VAYREPSAAAASYTELIARESELRQRLAAGDGAAFRALYDAQGPRLLRLLLRLLGDGGLAEEILQDTFLAAYESVGKFRGEATLAGWLARIALRRALNARRARARRKEEALDQVEMPDEVTQTAQSGLEGRDLARRVLGLMERLEPRKRQALLLQAEGYTASEIAEIEGEPRGTILARLFRARAELVELAAAEGLTPEGGAP
jgi:RNA polymerase sigma-70 factor (ECF subfamily)